jgi:hypothetical protein
MRTPLLLTAAFSLSFAACAADVQIQDNAPDRHVVVKGDTLWDISATFLKDPWQWPEVWRLNKEDIKNPHLIYPGDVVHLSRDAQGRALLSLEKGDRVMQTVKLSPSAHGEPIVIREPSIPPVPPGAIEPFLSHAEIIDPAALEDAPKLLGTVDDRVLMMVGDVVYADHGDGSTVDWNVVRPGAELKDPDTQESLGFESVHIGDAKTMVQDAPMTLTITRARMEVSRGDKLVPALPGGLENVVPHAPDKDIAGKIISAFGGLSATAQHATVVINKGLRDGIEVGHVLAISRQGREYIKYKDMSRHRYADTKCLKPGKSFPEGFYDPGEILEDCKGVKNPSMFTTKNAWRYMDVGCLKPGAKISADAHFNPRDVYKMHCRAGERLPDAHVGLVFVYRVHQKVAYALVTQANGPVYLLDTVAKP